MQGLVAKALGFRPADQPQRLLPGRCGVEPHEPGPLDPLRASGDLVPRIRRQARPVKPQAAIAVAQFDLGFERVLLE